MNFRQIMQNIFGEESEDEDDPENERNREVEVLEHEIEETNESKEEAEDNQTSEPKGVCRDHFGGSRSTETERQEDKDLLRAVYRRIFGDSDVDEWEDDSDAELNPENEGKVERKADAKVNKTSAPKGVYRDHHESSRSFGDSKGDVTRKYVVHNHINEENVRRSLKYKGNHAKEPRVGNVKVASPVVFEIPSRPPPVHPNQMATIKSSNIIGMDPKPFDSNTYVKDEFYVTGASGSKMRIPHTNIARWRKVRQTDGTTSVETNARFVIWSDDSLQLLIGNEAFDVCEHAMQDIHSHLFLKSAKGIVESQGRISKKMKVMPSSLSFNSHHFSTALVDSRGKKVNKIHRYITDVDPERKMEQTDKTERETTKTSENLNNKKRATEKYRYMGSTGHQRMPGFLSKDRVTQGSTKS